MPPGIAVPAITEVRSDGAVLMREPDGSFASRILVTFLRPSGLRDDVVAVEARYRVDGSAGAWTPLGPVAADAGEVSLAPVEDGETYAFALRYVTVSGARGAWSATRTHTVIGKTAPPADVASFSAQQNGAVVVFDWPQIPDLDLAGYEIRYARQGSFVWDDATPLTRVTRGTQITSAAMPPGAHTVGIKAADTSGNVSASAATTDLVVANANEIVVAAAQAPRWPGTLSGFVRHHTGRLVPDSRNLASADGWETFDRFVPNPVATAIYEAPEIDLGFDAAQVRVWADIQSVLGPGETTGVAAPRLEIDLRNEAGTYRGFTPWTVGTAAFRRLKARIVAGTADGLAVVTAVSVVADVAEREERGENVTVAPGGTSITFAQRFHKIPNVQVTPDGTSPRIPVKRNVTESGFDVQLFDAAGTDVGGICDWQARGP